MIHLRDSSGYEVWNEYDDNGNIIHLRDSTGYEAWYEYDNSGNLIHGRDSTGYEWWREYDTHGNMIHSRNSSIKEQTVITLMPLKDITKVSELLEILDWDLDGNGLVITDYTMLGEAVVNRFPELEDDLYTPDEEVE